jgi:hypothetical protein
MTPKTPHDPWARLVAAARQVPEDRETSAPYGFATRVAALAFSQERKPVSLFERFALRAVGVAALLALLSVTANYSAFTNSLASDDVMLFDDPVAELVEIAS